MSNLIQLSSVLGQQYLKDVFDNGKPCRKNIIRIFRKQIGRSNCGIQSLAITFSALSQGLALENSLTFDSLKPLIIPCGDSSGPGLEVIGPYTEEKMFDYPETLSVCDQAYVSKGGLTLNEVHRLAISHNKKAEMYQTSPDEDSLKQFRDVAIASLSSPGCSTVVIVNYLMSVLGQPFNGHHSPLAAYHEATDRFLIMDTWPDTESSWVPAKLLHEAMCAVDSLTGESRGYIIIKN